MLLFRPPVVVLVEQLPAKPTPTEASGRFVGEISGVVVDVDPLDFRSSRRGEAVTVGKHQVQVAVAVQIPDAYLVGELCWARGGEVGSGGIGELLPPSWGGDG